MTCSPLCCSLPAQFCKFQCVSDRQRRVDRGTPNTHTAAIHIACPWLIRASRHIHPFLSLSLILQTLKVDVEPEEKAPPQSPAMLLRDPVAYEDEHCSHYCERDMALVVFHLDVVPTVLEQERYGSRSDRGIQRLQGPWKWRLVEIAWNVEYSGDPFQHAECDGL